jgi:hypothetical protein
MNKIHEFLNNWLFNIISLFSLGMFIFACLYNPPAVKRFTPGRCYEIKDYGVVQVQSYYDDNTILVHKLTDGKATMYWAESKLAELCLGEVACNFEYKALVG